MKSATNLVFKVMNILAWIVFIGEMIKAGAILFDYFFSIFKNPEAVKNLKPILGLDLFNLKQYDIVEYSIIVIIIVMLELTKAYIAFMVIKVFSTIKISNPFSIEISKYLERISYLLLGFWALAMLFDWRVEYLMKHVTGLDNLLISNEIILLVGVVFVFAQIFKRGVEIQTENDLTV